MRDEAVADLRPIGADLHRGDGEDEQAEAAVAEDALHPLELTDQSTTASADDRQHEQQPVREPGQKLQRDRDAADLGREREQVHDLGGDAA